MGGLLLCWDRGCRTALTQNNPRFYLPFHSMAGGEDGQAGRNLLIKVDSKTGEVVKVLNLGGKNTVKVRPHDRFRLEAPGGGGYGAVSERKEGQAGKEATSAPYRKSGSVLQRNLDAYSV